MTDAEPKEILSAWRSCQPSGRNTDKKPANYTPQRQTLATRGHAREEYQNWIWVCHHLASSNCFFTAFTLLHSALWEGSPSGTDLSKIVPRFPTWSSSEGPLAFKIKPRSLARWWKAPFQPPPWRSWTNRHWPFHGSGPFLQQFPEPGLPLAMTGSQPWLQTQIIWRN